MLPASSTITHYLAKEYDQILRKAVLTRTTYQKSGKRFVFYFAGAQKQRLEYSFSPPDFVLLTGWPTPEEGFEIWQECAGSRVIAASATPDDRMITFQLKRTSASEEEVEFTIHFELFGALTNAFLVDNGRVILHAARVINDRRRLKPGKPYQPPERRPPDPKQGEILICSTIQVEYRLAFDQDSHQVIIAGELGAKVFAPDPAAPLTSLYQHLHQSAVRVNNISRLRRNLLTRVQQQLKKKKQSLTQLHTKLESCRQAEKLKQWADILMANQRAQPVGGTITLFDFYHNCDTEIPLLARKTLIETAAAYYKKAKKMKRAPSQLSHRLEDVEARISRLEAASAEIPKMAELEQLEKAALELRPLLGGACFGDTGKVEPAQPYRTFLSSAGEKILVGKSAVNNAKLTFKVARTYDFWFHAQQVKGSHVILVLPDKNKKPSRKSILEAAALAAYYSEARGLKQVPVIYTRRRHVRKVRKGAPGQVIPERVKSIFVDPQVPNSA